MVFQDAIKIVCENLTQIGTTLLPESYDGLIVKKLESSNTLDDGRKTNQTHIAITGEQMDIFPYLKADGYFSRNDDDLKKYFIVQIPVTIHESNCNYLSFDISGYHFHDGTMETKASVLRSKRANAADQIQMSLIRFDGEAFVDFRKALHTGDFLVILKTKGRLFYHAFGIKAMDVTEDVRSINNKFFKLSTNTVVNAAEDFLDHEKVIDTDTHRENYTIEELASILRKMYNNAKGSGQVAAIHMFGFKYGDVILSNSFSQKILISLAGINDSYVAELNKGINIFRSVKNNEYGVSFEGEGSIDESTFAHSVYGMHITAANNALSADDPHICIGWAKLGDLSDCASKEDIAGKYEAAWPEAKAKAKGQDVGQIYRFVVESQIGDYVVFGDGSVAHIGIIRSDYYYCENPTGQDPDYVNNKKVEWIKDVPYSELSQQFKNSLGSAMSFFRLNDYKSVILELLSGAYEIDNTENDELMKNNVCDRNPRTNKTNPLNLIIYGAPGTGKTYSTTEYAVAAIEGRPVRKSISTEERKALKDQYRAFAKNGQIVFTTFHQNYSYEDFIQGLRPDSKNGVLDFIPVDGVFKQLAFTAMHDQVNNYVIIIDEINRGNISKVFGELITLIEEDKRWGEDNQLSVTLPSGEEFAVPNNLYIIGTMNSADKSIALIDTALRRRFEFEEVAPNPELVEDETLKKVLISLNTLLRKQLDSSDLLIGHAYFIGKTVEELPSILNRNIIPLLYEYFYDQEKKVKDALAKALEGTSVTFDENNQGRIRVK